ncbi:MAG: DNA methyltransferase [Candidatus Nanopelagicales bacterium]
MIDIKQRDYRETLSACRGAADLVFFSPPYCDARNYGLNANWTMDDYASLGDACFEAVRPGGNVIVNISAPVRDWGNGYTERGLHPFRMLIDWHDRIGFQTPDWMAYGRDGVPGKWSLLFRSGWEPLWWFRRPGPDPVFRPERLSVPATTAGMVRRRFSTGPDTWTSGSFQVRPETRLPTSLWNYGNIDNFKEPTDGQHPARWSIRLATDIVQCFSDPGSLTCDPFTGAGTSALAAAQGKRSFVGGDIGARRDGKPWSDIANELIHPVLQQVEMFGGGL